MSDVLERWPLPWRAIPSKTNPAFSRIEPLGIVMETPLAEFIVAAASPPAADPLDVERLAEALHAVGVGCSSYICEPTTSTYIGLRKTMHETDAREVAAEYARLAREGEQPVAGPDAPGSRPSTRHEHSEE